MVTHEPEMAAFAERILTFRDGRILRDEATPRAVEARA
jgi:ABC-type lipoprotein export system ATPase subunit